LNQSTSKQRPTITVVRGRDLLLFHEHHLPWRLKLGLVLSGEGGVGGILIRQARSQVIFDIMAYSAHCADSPKR
jgi:hypothetical protein